MKWKTVAAGTAVVLCVSASRLCAFSGPEPKGFDKVKFGTSIEATRKAYPKMKAPEPGTKAAALNHPKIARFILPKAKLPGLEKATDVDFQFWTGKFWLAQIHFADTDPAKIEAYLRKNYGAPDYQDDNYMTWNGKTAAAVFTKRAKTFEVHDEGMSNEARAELFKGGQLQASMQQIKKTPAAAAPTPASAATPAK